MARSFLLMPIGRLMSYLLPAIANLPPKGRLIDFRRSEERLPDSAVGQSGPQCVVPDW